jgi:hypothetical protein
VYIKTAKRSGLHHLSFGHVGGSLRKQIRMIREYIDGTGVQLYHNPQGSFCYFLSNVIKKIGYLDEKYKNAFEHVDYEYQLVKAGIMPAFWWFPDIKDSYKYIQITPGGASNSSITDRPEYNENYKMSAQYFIEKWGHFTKDIVDIGEDAVEQRMNFIENTYSLKSQLNNDKKLAVIIPFRNRHQNLKEIIPELKKTISKQNSNYQIFVIEQSGGKENGTGDWHDGNKPFNKGMLFNAGVDIVKKEGFDYVILHDVDLIPECSDYGYPQRPTHLSYKVSQFGYKPQYNELFGGVFSISVDDYYKVNGYTNEFFGWGKEDDDFYIRLEKQWGDISLSHLYYGRYKSLPHTPVQSDPNWIQKNNYGEKHSLTQKYQSNELKSDSGVNNIRYNVINAFVDDNNVRIITIEI